MQAGLRALFAGTGASLCCLFLLWVICSHLLKEGQLAVGTCEIVTLNRDSSQPRRMIARQTAVCLQERADRWDYSGEASLRRCSDSKEQAVV